MLPRFVRRCIHSRNGGKKMHLSILRTMDEVTSRFRGESSPPLNGISRILKRRARFCNSQLPDLGQVRHSLGWSERMSSATILRAFITRRVLVRTTIPSVQRVAQAGARFFSSFYFYYTDPAGSGIIFNAGSFQVDVAQGRYINPYLTCSFQ